MPYPYVGLSVLQWNDICGRSMSKAHPGAAGKSHELQVWRKNIQGADCTLNHVTIDPRFDVRFLFLLIS